MAFKFIDSGTGEKREGQRRECVSSGGEDGPVLREIPVRYVSKECIESFEIGRFVGREREMETLRRGMASAVAGDGRLILIAGERGVGKTRLADEAGRFAASEGAQVLWGRCWEGEGAPPFWPFIQILRGYLKGWTTADALKGMGGAAADIGRLLPELRESKSGLCVETVGAEPGGADLDRDEHRFRLFDGLATLFKSGAEYQPLMLIVDDLHWADQPSLVLLEFLAGEMRDARILLIATYRDDAPEPGHPLSGVLAELVRHSWSEQLALRGLTEGEVARFMARDPRDERPDAMVRAVHGKTEGNPFFVRELVRLLAAEGRLGDAKPGRCERLRGSA